MLVRNEPHLSRQTMMDHNWSQAEKKVARRAFDTALARENAALLAELKCRAEQASRPEDIWAIHDFLSQRRKEIDSKYDYRYSQLLSVFCRLYREKWLDENDLTGLREEKIAAIRRAASW
jgi:hypothetical protein